MKTTGITLIVFGLCAIVMTIVLTIRRNRKYSVPVTARCIRVEERYLPMEGNQRAGVTFSIVMMVIGTIMIFAGDLI